MSYEYSQDEQTTLDRFFNINWLYMLIVTALVLVGLIILKSVAMNTDNVWAEKQLVRFFVGFGIVIAISLTNIRFWMKYSYAIYFVFLGFLIMVDFMGFIGMGAQRWIKIGPVNFQPSEVMKFGVILALARYFHSTSIAEVETIPFCVIPFLLVAVPAALILKQPDLGTTLLIVSGGVAVFFMVGVQYWKFFLLGGMGACSMPILWHFLHDYQKDRVLTFLDPERDPLGKGYHILQSKITLGSGGVFGKGYMAGTQSHLNFLPEKHTDFIFTVIAEEFGLIGSLGVIFLYVILLILGYLIAVRSQNHFGKIVAAGITTYIFVYFFVNIAMVTGLLPVVGAPLPLISYGGSSLLTLMFGFGLIQCVNTNRNVIIGKKGANFDDDF